MLKLWLERLPGLLLITVAVVWAASARSTARSATTDATTLKTVFAAIAAAEPEQRLASQRAFPGDPWSQDDDFHNAEQRLVRQLAVTHRLSVQDVLLALDHGMRERWPSASGASLKNDVPPCHPRPFYD